jgi:site-specific DNA recombinase
MGTEAKEKPNQRQLQMQRSRVQRQISKLIDAYSEGLIEKKEFEPRIREARLHLEKLQAEAQTQEQLQAQLQEMRQVIGHLQAFAERVQGNLDQADWTLQRQLISTLVKRVEVGTEEVRIVYRVDCGPFELAPSGGPGQDCWRRRGATRAPLEVTVRMGRAGCSGPASPSRPRRFRSKVCAFRGVCAEKQSLLNLSVFPQDKILISVRVPSVNKREAP